MVDSNMKNSSKQPISKAALLLMFGTIVVGIALIFALYQQFIAKKTPLEEASFRPVRDEQWNNFGGIKESDINMKLKALEEGQVGAPVVSVLDLQKKLDDIANGGSGFSGSTTASSSEPLSEETVTSS
jgi:hypothetical protein